MQITMYHTERWPIGVDKPTSEEEYHSNVKKVKEFRSNFKLLTWPYWSHISGDPTYMDGFKDQMRELGVFFFQHDQAHTELNGKRYKTDFPIIIDLGIEKVFPFDGYKSVCKMFPPNHNKQFQVMKNLYVDQNGVPKNQERLSHEEHPILNDHLAWSVFSQDHMIMRVFDFGVQAVPTNEENWSNLVVQSPDRRYTNSNGEIIGKL